MGNPKHCYVHVPHIPVKWKTSCIEIPHLCTFIPIADIQVDEYYPTFLNMAKNFMEGLSNTFPTSSS